MAKTIDANELKAKLIGCKAFYTDLAGMTGNKSDHLTLLNQFSDLVINMIDSMAEDETDDRP